MKIKDRWIDRINKCLLFSDGGGLNIPTRETVLPVFLPDVDEAILKL